MQTGPTYSLAQRYGSSARILGLAQAMISKALLGLVIVTDVLCAKVCLYLQEYQNINLRIGFKVITVLLWTGMLLLSHSL